MRDYAEQVKALREGAEWAEKLCAHETAKRQSDAADAIEELLAERNKALKKLCEWCGVCSEENRKALECDDIAVLDAPHWISVKERLPESGEFVLFYCPYIKSCMVGWFDDNFHLEGYGRAYDYSLVKPSHWMPPPAPPKGVE